MNPQCSLIIANPPYGPIASHILDLFLTNKLCTKLVYLTPIKANTIGKQKIFKNHLTNVIGPYSLSTHFNIPEGNDQDLYITHYDTTSLSPFQKRYEEVMLSEKARQYKQAVVMYNSNHPRTYKFLHTMSGYSKEEWESFSQSLIFEIPLFTPANGVQMGGQSWAHNHDKHPIQYTKSNNHGILFQTQQEFDHFYNFYYTRPYSWNRKRRTINCVMDMMLYILKNLYAAGPGISHYDEVLPHLDWAKPWTDVSIIQELKDGAGLPLDWTL